MHTLVAVLIALVSTASQVSLIMPMSLSWMRQSRTVTLVTPPVMRMPAPLLPLRALANSRCSTTTWLPWIWNTPRGMDPEPLTSLPVAVISGRVAPTMCLPPRY